MALTDILTELVKKTPVEKKSTRVKDRFLPERSFLIFEFPVAGRDRPMRITLPFLENINISENGKANFAVHDVLSRPGSLYTYLGSKSRKLRLKFNLTLPHIQYEMKGNLLGYFGYISLDDKESEKDRFVNKHGMEERRYNPTDPFLSQAAFARRYFESLKNNDFTETVKASSKSDEPLELMLWWSNIIRASTVGNAIDPTLGPPIVRVNHGLMYKNIPCICMSYNIELADRSTYDLKTLMPRELVVSMELEEIRMGDFGEYLRGGVISGDNVTGWEAVISDGTMDPDNFVSSENLLR